MINPSLREVYRSRWRRQREGIRLLDVQQDAFAAGGLGVYTPDLAVRLVVLPGDPENEWIDFNDQFWEWWKGQQKGPFDGIPSRWDRSRSMASAAVRYRPLSDDSSKWRAYLALYRHGGLDVGLGHDGARQLDENTRIFVLLAIVGSVWTALHLYTEAVARFKINGPWECSAALLRTKGAKLGGFGTGWAQYNDPDANPLPCLEPNLWWRREMDKWPQPAGIRDLAYSIGSWIEDSWGMRCRRFLALTGALAGQFDTVAYRSY